jgi:hypothetical protein
MYLNSFGPSIGIFELRFYHLNLGFLGAFVKNFRYLRALVGLDWARGIAWVIKLN